MGRAAGGGAGRAAVFMFSPLTVDGDDAPPCRCSGPGRSARSVPEPLTPFHSGPRLPGSLPGPGSGHPLVPV